MALVIPNSPSVVNDIQEIAPEELDAIRRLLEERIGFNLGMYKDKCVMRRINIRIRATNSATPKDYCRLLAQDERELPHLAKALTIHVSHFFRNPSVFDSLCNTVIPEIFSRYLKDGRELIFWSVGCATGEEPYTLAIILREYFTELIERVPVRIIATDINAEILDIARRGLYGPERVAEVSPDLLARYFTAEGVKLRLAAEIRNMVTFSQEEIFSAGFERKCDLILCRNVMIYLERPWQERMLNGFAESLSGGGFLVLGKSETMVGESRRFFLQANPVERIYQATAHAFEGSGR
ncbi:protein-glutamate O-methyltransferase CheR [Geobacter pelophilus]|uniref:protein-glutamate O-methyltransferase n=1 Tax=Geoanaerobacter pelophilus TaxID=60036 RepID=A0AAW4KZL7_9BACT|nr:protein-glutamate O-methyltransferase CheR [Geoanaerobacter pelophilus]MBT0664018.1 protein-glutamate O-methyltransferase CheR [Geoanaerobacter pelophilus]